MKCPYQDIGCWYIDDVTHDCEAPTMSVCRHMRHPQEPAREQKTEDDEE